MKYFSIVAMSLILTSCADTAMEKSQIDANPELSYEASKDSLRFEGEVHLRNIRQLTFGGNNAEAYFSRDDKKLIFQSDWSRINDQGCDQIYSMNIDGEKIDPSSDYTLVSTGKGRTTCSYFLPDGRIIYSSTHADRSECPESPSFGDGRYLWAIYDSYDIYVADADGSNAELLIGGPGYDAEPTVSPDGQYIIYTSTRTGDLELWRFEIETGENIMLTNTVGYDGGAFFSPDSKKIVWRASRPVGEEAEAFTKLLGEGLVEPSDLNVFVADIDGNNVRQLTDLPGANWAPFFHPDGKRVVMASNHHMVKSNARIFDLFLISEDGAQVTQLTHSGTFDAFPMFSYDGRKIVFSSNRRGDRMSTRDTNVFVADWVEKPSKVDSLFAK